MIRCIAHMHAFSSCVFQSLELLSYRWDNSTYSECVFLVVVLVMDEERSFVKPKAILHKGQSFGELAIIHGDKRRSTVVAMEEVEMLAIWFEVSTCGILNII